MKDIEIGTAIAQKIGFLLAGKKVEHNLIGKVYPPDDECEYALRVEGPATNEDIALFAAAFEEVTGVPWRMRAGEPTKLVAAD